MPNDPKLHCDFYKVKEIFQKIGDKSSDEFYSRVSEIFNKNEVIEGAHTIIVVFSYLPNNNYFCCHNSDNTPTGERINLMRKMVSAYVPRICTINSVSLEQGLEEMDKIFRNQALGAHRNYKERRDFFIGLIDETTPTNYYFVEYADNFSLFAVVR